MTVFRYQAVSQQGEMKSGSINAKAEAEVIAQLQGLGLIPLSVENRISPVKENQKHKRFLKRHLRPTDIEDLTRQLSALLTAGLSLDRALQTIKQVSGFPQLVELVTSLQGSVREGKSFSSALADFPALFSNFYVNFIRAAEISGNLAAGIRDLLDYLEKARALKERLVSALIYPTVLILVTMISLGIIMFYVLPEFAQLFEDMNATLPSSTAFILGISDIIRKYSLIFAAIIAGLYLYIRQRYQDGKWRLEWDRRVLSISLLSGLIKKIEMARFSRCLGTLLRGGVPLVSALHLSGECIQNRAMLHRLESVVADVKEGTGLASPLLDADIFPELALQMILVGEETGKLDDMLLKVADIYEQEVATSLQRLLSILEPLLILGLGIAIGGIIMSILVAILSINDLPI